MWPVSVDDTPKSSCNSNNRAQERTESHRANPLKTESQEDDGAFKRKAADRPGGAKSEPPNREGGGRYKGAFRDNTSLLSAQHNGRICRHGHFSSPQSQPPPPNVGAYLSNNADTRVSAGGHDEIAKERHARYRRLLGWNGEHPGRGKGEGEGVWRTRGSRLSRQSKPTRSPVSVSVEPAKEGGGGSGQFDDGLKSGRALVSSSAGDVCHS